MMAGGGLAQRKHCMCEQGPEGVCYCSLEAGHPSLGVVEHCSVAKGNSARYWGTLAFYRGMN